VNFLKIITFSTDGLHRTRNEDDEERQNLLATDRILDMIKRALFKEQAAVQQQIQQVFQCIFLNPLV
jgi:hypothetical protein